MTMTKRLLGWLVGAFAVLTVLAFALAMGAGGRVTDGWWMSHMWGGWMGMGVWGFGMMFVGLLWMVLLVVLPAAFVYWAATERGSLRSDPAMERLREQYARGEIDDDEYESRRRRLSGQ